MDRFVAAAEALTIGDPFDPATRFSVAGEQAALRQGRLLRRESPRRWAARSSPVASPRTARGSCARRSSTGCRWMPRPYCEEIFGPVCVVNRFDTEDEAVHLANDTRYGLNAMLFTENLSRAHRVASKLRAGTVWVNCFFIRDLRTPFGGVGDCGRRPRGRQLLARVLHRAQGRRHADRPRLSAGAPPLPESTRRTRHRPIGQLRGTYLDRPTGRFRYGPPVAGVGGAGQG